MIGFVGSDKYDILLYISKILCQLGQRILLVDYSESRALTYSIPTPHGERVFYTVREEDCLRYQVKGPQEEDPISYQGFDFVIEPMYDTLLKLRGNYDIILIDFGFQVYSKLITSCELIYLCSDAQLHHIMQLKPLKLLEEEIKDKCYLLYRQVYDCKIHASYLLDELDFDLESDHIYTYYEDLVDMKYCIDSQYNHTYHFMKISKGLKSCLLFLIRTMLPMVTEQAIRHAYRSARITRSTIRSYDY